MKLSNDGKTAGPYKCEWTVAVAPRPATSSSGSTPINNWTSNTKLDAGTYTIAQCNGNTGTVHTQITAGFANCWNAFSSATNAGYWNNQTGNCNGEAVVSFPVTVTVPAGQTLTLSNCWK